MSGNQKRLIKVQGTMAGITVLLSAFLIPMWGIVGAAVSIAATAALSNAWYLRELRSSLGMSPYNRDYLHLIPAAAASLAAALVLHSTMGWVRPEWAVIALSGGVCYALLLTITVTMGLGDDDRLIARSILARIRTSFGKPRVNAA
jgi:O-antigen/teichoic acid export membrane protein